MSTPRELKNLPKGDVVTAVAVSERVGEVSPLAPLAGPTPEGVLTQRESVKSAPGSNRKPR